MDSFWGVNVQTLWLAIGFFLLAAELLSTGFVFIFLGLGALITAILLMLGLDLSISTQIVVFVLMSLASLLLLRKPLQKKFNQSKEGDYNDFKGQTCEVVHWNLENNTGSVKFRGANWQAQSNRSFEIGQIATIESVDGITLMLH